MDKQSHPVTHSPDAEWFHTSNDAEIAHRMEFPIEKSGKDRARAFHAGEGPDTILLGHFDHYHGIT
jgi:hypothetical protein